MGGGWRPRPAGSELTADPNTKEPSPPPVLSEGGIPTAFGKAPHSALFRTHSNTSMGHAKQPLPKRARRVLVARSATRWKGRFGGGDFGPRSNTHDRQVWSKPPLERKKSGETAKNVSPWPNPKKRQNGIKQSLGIPVTNRAGRL